MFNLVAPASEYLLLDTHLFLKSYVWRIYQKMINWKNSEVTCVCRVKVHHRGNQHPFMHTSHILKNNFIYLEFFYLFIIYFLQYCVGFRCTTVLILFIFVCTGPSWQCTGLFLLRSTGSSGQASAVVARGLSHCISRPQSRGPTVVVHGISCSTTGRWELPRPGTKPVSPALAGGFFYH